MTSSRPKTFEELVISQTQALTATKPADFDANFQAIGREALEYFDIDRLSMYPNSMILMNDGKLVSVARENVPTVTKSKFIAGNHKDYLKLLRSRSHWQAFSGDEMKNHPLDAFKVLYAEGVRWHGIIRLELFGQVWGALSFARFGDRANPVTERDIMRLRALCDIWLCYWQHSIVSQSLSQEQPELKDENEKLLLLSKKQRAVLSLLAQGYTAKQCAEKLFLSHRTIESHKYRMMALLGFETVTEMIQFALRNGLTVEK